MLVRISVLEDQPITRLPLLILLMVLLVACTNNPESSDIATVDDLDSPDVEEIAAAYPPPAIVTVAGPSQEQKFVLTETTDAKPESTQTREPANPTSPVETESQLSSPGATEVPQETPTPGPTFTPPPAPESTSLDHLWFARPVPLGSSVWTDKAYPYGTTQGGTLRPHHGVEFNVPANTEVLAAADGIVRVAGQDNTNILGAARDFYGNVVVIEHGLQIEGQPIFTLYGHLSELLVVEGQEVEAGEVIALSGSSGVADGAHLHFEVRVGANDYASTRNPLLWLYPFPDRGVVTGKVNWPDGNPAEEVPLTLRRLDAHSPYRATTSYAALGINPDEGYGENFAFDDVDTGFYELTAGTGEAKVKITFWVYPYQSSFVEITLEG